MYIDFLVNPLPAIAIIGMAFNDHFLKVYYHSELVGKISDFLGMFYFPLFLCALIVLFKNFFRLSKGQDNQYIRPKLLLSMMFFSGALMALVNLSPRVALVIERVFSSYIFEVTLTPDPSDLWSLASLPLTYWYGQQFFKET